METLNRRRFLRHASLTASAAAATGILPRTAIAASGGGYKAMVCLFFKGGMDHNDFILPYDSANHALLQEARPNLSANYTRGPFAGSRSLEALIELKLRNQNALGGRRIAVPPQMAKLADLFHEGDLALVGGVGPLHEPTDRISFREKTVSLPARLFSHNDQQSTWMALASEGERLGWGGRIADEVSSASAGSNGAFSSITVSSNDVFLFGRTTKPFRLSSKGVPEMRIQRDRYVLGGNAEGDAARSVIAAAFERSDFAGTSVLERDLARFSSEGILNSARFREALEGVSEAIAGFFPSTKLGGQLKAAAQAIVAGEALGLNRQVIYGAIGGFDTHSGQANSLPQKQQEIAEAIAAFKTAMISIGKWNDVCLFTCSDFGRTLGDNGDGTDHGWGAHQIVVGGAVDGGRLYGDVARPDFEDIRYTDKRGRLIPSVSVEQFGAGIGQWFGVSPADLGQIFPRLSNFPGGALPLFGSASI